MKAVVKKQQTVDALVESFKGATAVYLLNFQGITVDKDNALRKALAAKGVKYHAVKNTLLKRVLEALKVEGLNDSAHWRNVCDGRFRRRPAPAGSRN